MRRALLTGIAIGLVLIVVMVVMGAIVALTPPPYLTEVPR